MATSTPNTILMTWLSAAGVPRPRYRPGSGGEQLAADGRVPAGVEREAEQAAEPGQHLIGHAARVEQRRVALDRPVGSSNEASNRDRNRSVKSSATGSWV